MWLIVGLGNPGAKYLLTRHNIGFMALDNWVAGLGQVPSRQEHKAITSRFKIEGQELLLAKPQTFMNKSGESVQVLLDYYKIQLEHLIVVHDDIDQAFNAIKIQRNRGAGGHNGLKSINESLTTQDYIRLKLGVGRPADPRMDVASYVLQNFSADEQSNLSSFLNRAGDAIEALIFEGFDKAATLFSRSGGVDA